MEKKIELENGSKLLFTGGNMSNADGLASIGRFGTSNGFNSRVITIKFGDKECSEYGSDEHVKIERNFPVMDETERKFIIMSRIAVALRRKGLHCSLSIQESDFCMLNVILHTSPNECVIVSDITSYDVTEAELLDWWSAIENGVE